MNKQQGWSLYETVLTIALSSIILGALSVSLYRPIQDVFALSQKSKAIKPALLAMIDLEKSLKQSDLKLVARDHGLSVFRHNQVQHYNCAKSSLTLQTEDNDRDFVLLKDVECDFQLQEHPSSWSVLFKMKGQADQYQRPLYRVFYVAKEEGYETLSE